MLSRIAIPLQRRMSLRTKDAVLSLPAMRHFTTNNRQNPCRQTDASILVHASSTLPTTSSTVPKSGRPYSSPGNSDEEATSISLPWMYFNEVLCVATIIWFIEVSELSFSFSDVQAGGVTLAAWPNEIQEDLMAGRCALWNRDGESAERHFTRAWEVIRSLAVEKIGPDAFVKVSDVAAILAHVLEQNGKKRQAYIIVAEAVEKVRPNVNIPFLIFGKGNTTSAYIQSYDTIVGNLPSQTPRHDSLTPDERLRLILLSIKLADMSQDEPSPEAQDLEKKWLGHAVEEMLEISKRSDERQRLASPSIAFDPTLPLPQWAYDLTTFQPFVLLRRLADIYQNNKTGGSRTVFSLFNATGLLGLISTLQPVSTEADRSDKLKMHRFVRRTCNIALAEGESCPLLSLIGESQRAPGERHVLEVDALKMANVAFANAERTVRLAWDSGMPDAISLCVEAFLRGAYAIMMANAVMGNDAGRAEAYDRAKAATKDFIAYSKMPEGNAQTLIKSLEGLHTMIHKGYHKK